MKVSLDNHHEKIDYPSSNKFFFFFFFVLTDNVLVTENGYENLTTVPKEVVEIEEIISRSV